MAERSPLSQNGLKTFVEEKKIHFIQDMNAIYKNKWLYMQDYAPIHVSKFTKGVLKVKEDVAVFEWPPHSPDLNIIENIWVWMKRKK